MNKQHILGFFDSLVRTPAFLFLCAMFLCGALAGGLTGLHAGEGDSAIELAAVLSGLPGQALKSVLCIGGSWLVPADALEAGDYDRITKLAREAVEGAKL